MLATAFLLIIIILFIGSPFAFFWTYKRPAGSEFFGFAGRGLVAGLVSWSLLIVPLGLLSGYGPFLFYFLPGLPFAGVMGIILTLIFRFILRQSGWEPRGIVRALLGAAAGFLLGGAIGAWFGYEAGYEPWKELVTFGFMLGFIGIFSGIMAGESSS